MTRILLSGCCGAMGDVISSLVPGRSDVEIVAGIDVRNDKERKYQIFPDFSCFSGSCDVIVDFSLPDALEPLLAYALAKKLPCVLCATGYTDEQKAKIRSAANSIPIFWSSNMSIGINALCALASAAAKMLGNSFDIEIVEAHHRNKLDAPSGTALMIADSISKELEESPFYQFDRHSARKKRSDNEIGIHSIRGGTITGEHEVVFAGDNEVLTIKHSAQSRGVFASGAVNAAVFITKQQPGIYDMNAMIRS